MDSSSPSNDYEALRQAHAEQPVQRSMMPIPLRITDVMRRAERLFPEQEIVSRYGPGHVVHQTVAQVGEEARRLAAALLARQIRPGMRVATLMWNHSAHLAACYAVPGIHAVLHTLNLRLSAEELAYIIADAGDAAILIDEDLLPLLREIERFVQVPVVIVHSLGEQPSEAALQSGYPLWADVLAATPPLEQWHEDAIDENTPMSICYTSGTTGRPKGVVYSHRSALLHSMATSTVDALRISGRDSVMLLTPIFHANGWCIPYTALMFGAKLLLPGPRPTSEELADLMEAERITAALGVPTFWSDFLNTVERHPGRWKFQSGARLYTGGAAPPAEMFRRFDRLGLYLQTGWGMTEMSPMGSQVWIKRGLDEVIDEDQRMALRTSSGIALPFVEMRHVDDDGQVLPWDGQSLGELQVRGPYVAQGYIGHPDPISATTADGWLQTGDIAVIQPTGYLRLVDRKKDLVKSGGEWISSTDMENALCDHPSVAEAAVIAIPDERWGERPLAVLALKPGADASENDIKAHLLDRFPKWMVPDQIVILDSLPRTGVGKLNKMELRRRFS